MKYHTMKIPDIKRAWKLGFYAFSLMACGQIPLISHYK